ncbi:MAG: indolepyruvate oxidoreductase subunit beta [Proteobacteria bacterium]|nr:indolepyruvate oxidoreductase subunit beta [Pseudomonadota bacterium]
MNGDRLSSDPYNVIITGVGGQGNVLASKVMGNMLARQGLFVTIGESFGGNQRGGSVSSHVRVSEDATWSPQVPKGAAHAIVGLEATETFRILVDYGNPGVKVICNTRPIHSVGVISGELNYPDPEDVRKWMAELSARCWFLDATDEAMKMGGPIFGNIVLIGALAGIEALPLFREDFEAVMAETMPPEKLAVNMTAYDLGVDLVRSGDAAAS